MFKYNNNQFDDQCLADCNLDRYSDQSVCQFNYLWTNRRNAYGRDIQRDGSQRDEL